jgi:hypothetical protein
MPGAPRHMRSWVGACSRDARRFLMEAFGQADGMWTDGTESVLIGFAAWQLDDNKVPVSD